MVGKDRAASRDAELSLLRSPFERMSRYMCTRDRRRSLVSDKSITTLYLIYFLYFLSVRDTYPLRKEDRTKAAHMYEGAS